MIYVLGAMAGLAALWLGFWLAIRAADKMEWLSAESVIAFLFWSVLLGLVFGAVIEREKSGPCVQYETQIHYNAATKSMMPAKVCVNRGEWELAQ